MAISDTMSSPNSDWSQLYHRHSLTSTTSLQGSNTILADATVVTTTVTSPTAPAGGGTVSSTRQLSPEGGRVSKPARRRRASRAAPTTLLNTDTTNFRAMVQQFTGVPSAPFTFGSQISAPNLSFGLAQQHQNVTGIVGPRGNYYSGRYHHQQQHLHYDQQQQNQQQYYQMQQQQQQYNVFPDALRGNNSMEGASDGFMNFEGVSSSHHHHHHEQHQVVFFPPAAGSSPSSNGNRSTNNGGYNS